MTMITQPKSEPKDDSMIKFLLEESKSAKEQTNKLIETMVAQKPSVDPMKQILQTMEVMQQLKQGLGGDDGESKDWKDKLTDAALEHGPTLLAMITGGLTAQKNGLPPEVGVSQVIDNRPSSYSPSNPLPQQPRPIPTNPVSEIDQLLSTPAVIAIISQKINEDMRGWEFGDLVSNLYGRPTYNQISNIGETELFNAITRNSQLRQMISTFPDEKLKIWVKEFVNMDEEIKNQEVEEEKELIN